MQHRVPQVQIGRGWVEPGFHPQRTTGFELLDELLLNQQVVAAALDDIQLFFDIHVQFAVAPLECSRSGGEPITPTTA